MRSKRAELVRRSAPLVGWLAREIMEPSLSAEQRALFLALGEDICGRIDETLDLLSEDHSVTAERDLKRAKARLSAAAGKALR